MEMSPEAFQEMATKVSPSLIEANHILSLSMAELRQAITLETSQNPALEVLDHETCAVCGEPLRNGQCDSCSRDDAVTDSSNDDMDSIYENYAPPTRTSVMVEDEEFDPMTLIASEARTQDTVKADLHAVLPEEDRAIADYLIDSLDDNGYLSVPLQTLVEELGVEYERAERVLLKLQEIAPAGVGARDLKECLLLQIAYLESEGETPEFVREIVEDHLDELGSHKYGYLARQLHTTPENIGSAREFIKNNLTPFPLQDSKTGRTWRSPSRSIYVSPDVIIYYREGKLSVEIVEGRQFELKLNPAYMQISAQLEKNSSYFSREERNHIREYVSRTKLFISNVNQRRKTIYKIANSLVELQGDFILHGVRHLKPLTRATLAEHIGVHESTVSRATAGKFVMLPCHKVIPFSDFFTASLSVKDIIREMITQENGPLTDRQIGDRLRERGIRVARRTVAKYRAELGILPSTLR